MLSKTSKTYKYFDAGLKMMFEKPDPWNSPEGRGEGDALLRTARAYIAYPDKDLYSGIVSCFKMESDGHYQAYRCAPDIGAEDVSRDQTLYALIALKFNDDLVTFKEIGRKLRFRLSKRFIQGPGMWLWIRERWFLYGITEIVSVIFGILWNKILYRIQKRTKLLSDEEYMAMDPNPGSWQKKDYGAGPWYFDETVTGLTVCQKMYNEYSMKKDTKKWYRFLDKTEYPTYASVMTALMVYLMPNTIFRRTLVKLLMWNAKGENNLLLRALFLNDVSQSDVLRLKAMNGYRWTSRFDGTGFHWYLRGEDALYNVLDKDMLYAIISKNNKK